MDEALAHDKAAWSKAVAAVWLFEATVTSASEGKRSYGASEAMGEAHRSPSSSTDVKAAS